MTDGPLSTFAEVVERFPGLVELEPEAVGSFVLSCAQDFPHDLRYDEASNSNDGPKEFWQAQVIELLGDIENWQSATARGEEVSLTEFAGSAVREVVIAKETKQLVEELPTLPADLGFDRVVAYLHKWGFEQEVALAPSPLFSEGRAIRKPLDAVINSQEKTFEVSNGLMRTGLYEATNSLDDNLQAYMKSEYEIARIQSRLAIVLGDIERPSPEKTEHLKKQYGAKAANLMIFKKAIEEVYSYFTDEEREDYLETISVPPFEAVGVDMYEVWRSKSSEFDSMLEAVRQQAQQLATETEGGLVVVRSSAVFSEDDDNYTGAGIYKTILADPNDPEAFKEAVRAVYKSVDSAAAVTYRAEHNIYQELMGLVVQAYVEKNEAYTSIETHGFVNSRAQHEKVIEAHTPHGILLYDKAPTQTDLFLQWARRDIKKYLHSLPDHNSKLNFITHQLSAAVQAASFAEHLFGKPVQIEFTGKDIVQVRPLPSSHFEQTDAEIAFLDDQVEITKTRSIGVGDVTYNQLLLGEDNRGKEGFILFMKEYGFSDNKLGTKVLPAKGAVVVLQYSESGHLQTLCQERGLLCFYPDKKSESLEELMTYWDEHWSDDEEVLKALQLRFISDGYEGRIYGVNK